MKKIVFVSVCLLMTLVTFAEGKPAFANKSDAVAQQKEFVVKPVVFTTCMHTATFSQAYIAEAHMNGFVAGMAQYAFIDQNYTSANGDGTYSAVVFYTPSSGRCNSGDMYFDPLTIEVQVPQLPLK